MGDHSSKPSLTNVPLGDRRNNWSNIVKLGTSLYREKPGQDKWRPKQATPVENFFLAGSYTYQDYLDSMEGATRSGLMVADEIIARADGPNGLKAQSRKAEAAEQEVAFG